MGRHVPRLSFLSVLLSDEEALTPAEDCYHRLLTVGEQDELEFVEAYLKANSLTALYDSVFIPVIIATETDHRLELLDDEQRLLIEQSLRDIIGDLDTRPQVPSKIDANGAAAEDTQSRGPAPPFHVYCLPARADRDELAGAMLTQLLQQQGFVAQNAPGKLAADGLLEPCGKVECGRGLHLGSLAFDRHSSALSLRKTTGAFPSTENSYRTLGHDPKSDRCGQTAARFGGERGCDHSRRRCRAACKTCADARRANDAFARACGC